MLTQKQQQVLNTINDYINEHGFPPTVREIGKAMGLKSTSTVHSHLKILERKGYIKRLSDCPRAIKVIL